MPSDLRQTYNTMITAAPSPEHDIDIFAGEWMCELPIPGVKSGSNKLFTNDARLVWADSKFGGMRSQNILELGPREGGHTYQLEKHYGAASVTAIEASPHAFLRCLIAKNLLDMKNSKFLLGNFVEYLKKSDEYYDLIFASGVLHHMQRPAELLELISSRTKRLFLWTAVYNERLVESNTNLNSAFHYDRTRSSGFDGYLFREYCYVYGDGPPTPIHPCSTDEYAYWLQAEDIIGLLHKMGFTRVEQGLIDRDNKNGPNLCFVAERV